MQIITRLHPLPLDNFSTLKETVGGAKSLVRCRQTEWWIWMLNHCSVYLFCKLKTASNNSISSNNMSVLCLLVLTNLSSLLVSIKLVSLEKLATIYDDEIWNKLNFKYPQPLNATHPVMCAIHFSIWSLIYWLYLYVDRVKFISHTILSFIQCQLVIFYFLLSGSDLCNCTMTHLHC